MAMNMSRAAETWQHTRLGCTQVAVSSGASKGSYLLVDSLYAVRLASDRPAALHKRHHVVMQGLQGKGSWRGLCRAHLCNDGRYPHVAVQHQDDCTGLQAGGSGLPLQT